MRILAKPEVFYAVQFAKSLEEHEAAELLTCFQDQHPIFSEALFGGFPQLIAIQDQGMAHLFMDLCFEVLCVYNRCQGSLPLNIVDEDWLQHTFADMDDEIKSLGAKPSSKSLPNAVTAQVVLLEYLNLAVSDYVEEHPAGKPARVAVDNFLYMVTRLFDLIYDAEASVKH